MRVCLLLPYKKLTGAALPFLVFAKELSFHADVVVLIKVGGKVERFCLEKGIKYRPFSPLNVFRAVSVSDYVFSVRSNDTLWAVLSALTSGKGKVFRMDFHDRRIFWDRFVERIGVESLGWIDDGVLGRARKSRKINLCVVSRLKPERDVGGFLEEICSSKVRFRLFVTGKGEELSSLKGRFSVKCGVVFISRRLRRFFDFLSAMDVLLYPKAGTDKSARSVLEAMINRVVVVSPDSHALRYVEHAKTGLAFGGAGPLSGLLLAPSLLCRMRCNAFKKAEKFFIQERIGKFLKMMEDENSPAHIQKKL